VTRRYQAAAVETSRGDTVHVQLVTPDNGDATILVSLDDADDCVMPTAEFTIKEAADFREILRQACESALAGNVIEVIWPPRP